MDLTLRLRRLDSSGLPLADLLRALGAMTVPVPWTLERELLLDAVEDVLTATSAYPDVLTRRIHPDCALTPLDVLVTGRRDFVLAALAGVDPATVLDVFYPPWRSLSTVGVVDDAGALRLNLALTA